ncbi:rhodanese-like domain-containing protein [Paracraurococcus lichenis]|uniref:Rhodanese-like domain-containing protein n=1 Tax=Paracraurococcus lichenis TaxID=3064888 RepID=A0ABT9E5P0_9PROT|nr:rhodanese-like domain-containing protein [Paracraurococcus sp. LOR1-02]MDO9711487.1 rhodanese-like domain-containing protein [Paracraurococcus sp. LOR1-02]
MALKAALRTHDELVILDVREEGRFADRGHLLFAASAPLGRIELLIRRLVPRDDTRIVLTDEGETLAHRAASLLRGFGYTDVSVLAGGIEAWAAAGYELFTGVHVPSKAFGEVVEHEQGTPRLEAAEIHRLRDAGQDVVIVDGRPYAEYQVMSIPGGIDCPNAELVYRVPDRVPSPDTLVVVNCAGRTRSIIGAQTLINAGLPNRVVALKNGTMGWEIAGLPLEYGQSRTLPPPGPEGLAWSRHAALDLARRAGLRFIDRATLERFRAEAGRSLYLFDVRGPEEYLAGHLPGARSASGGQLVQETDRYVGTLRSRIVLVDDDAVRAPVTASWLVQLGWPEVYVLEGGLSGALEVGPEPLQVPGLAEARAPFITPAALAERIGAGQAFVIDIESSLTFRKVHIPGAWFTTRRRLAEAAAQAPAEALLVVTSEDGILARFGATELAAATGRDVQALLGGTAAWRAAGHVLEQGDARILTTEDIWYPPHFRSRDREAGMHAYLQWELDLVAQIARDGDARFHLLPSASRDVAA